MLYIDADDFKEINDAYGHPTGDQVLKQLALQIADVRRSFDTVTGIGGDEFAILLPDTGKEELELMANKLSNKIQQLKIQEQSFQINVTVSIGGKSFIADFPLKSMAE